MSVINMHDSECDAGRNDGTPCVCKQWPRDPPKPPRGGPPDDVADSNTKLTDIVIGMPVNIQNPVFVYGSSGKPVGSAVLEFVHGGMQARLFLDAHNPEAFDLANEPSRCTFKLIARIVDGEMDKASLWLDSK